MRASRSRGMRPRRTRVPDPPWRPASALLPAGLPGPGARWGEDWVEDPVLTTSARWSSAHVFIHPDPHLRDEHIHTTKPVPDALSPPYHPKLRPLGKCARFRKQRSRRTGNRAFGPTIDTP